MNRKILVKNIAKVSQQRKERDVKDTKKLFGNDYENVEYVDATTGRSLLVKVI